MDMRQFIEDQISVLDIDQTWSSSEVKISCPFHNDPTPSCGIKLDHDGFLPPGVFYCFGCGASGRWNTIANALDLQTIGKDSAQENIPNYDFDKVRNNLFGEEGFNSIHDLAENLHAGGMIINYPYDNWRGIRGSVIRKVGGKLVHDSKSDMNSLLLPQWVGKKLVGGIKARLVKEERGINYLFSSNDWILTKGLYPYKLVKDLKPGTIVLVEGARDALHLIQKGIPALGILGTNSWSDSKRSLLMNLDPERVIVCMDGDKPGWGANNEIYWSLREQMVETKVLKLPEGQDPVDMDDKNFKILKKNIVGIRPQIVQEALQ